jgi:hypothetical protein
MELSLLLGSDLKKDESGNVSKLKSYCVQDTYGDTLLSKSSLKKNTFGLSSKTLVLQLILHCFSLRLGLGTSSSGKTSSF